jgi:hypothetical protein
MATAIRATNSSVTATSVAPAGTRDTGNNISDLRPFQLLSLLANPQTSTLNEEFIDRLYNSPSDAELLKLSPQALDVLNGVAVNNNEPTQLSLSLYLPAVRNPGGSGSSTPLTPLQIENISAIIAQHANEPFTLNTLVQIQKDLASASINPQQISLKTIVQIVSLDDPLATN